MSKGVSFNLCKLFVYWLSLSQQNLRKIVMEGIKKKKMEKKEKSLIIPAKIYAMKDTRSLL